MLCEPHKWYVGVFLCAVVKELFHGAGLSKRSTEMKSKSLITEHEKTRMGEGTIPGFRPFINVPSYLLPLYPLQISNCYNADDDSVRPVFTLHRTGVSLLSRAIVSSRFQISDTYLSLSLSVASSYSSICYVSLFYLKFGS